MRSVILFLMGSLPTFATITAANTPFSFDNCGACTGNAATITTTAHTHTAGNLLVASVKWYDGGTGITLSSGGVSNSATDGWTCGTQSTNAGDPVTENCWTLSTNGNASDQITLTFSAAATFVTVGVAEYHTSLAGSFSHDSTGSVQATSSSSPVSTTYSTSQTSEVVVACAGSGGGSGTFTAGSGYTLQGSNTSQGGGFEDQILTAIQSGATVQMSIAGGARFSIAQDAFMEPTTSTTVKHHGGVF